MFAETFDNYRYSTRLIPDVRSCTLSTSRENPMTRGQGHCELRRSKPWFDEECSKRLDKMQLAKLQ